MVVGAGSAPAPRFQSFLAGSTPGLMLVPDFVAAFHVPNTSLGEMALTLFVCRCQSPDVSFGLLVVSVTNAAGNSGRPDVSVAVVSPTLGFIAWSGFVVIGVTNGLTPSVIACSSL